MTSIKTNRASQSLRERRNAKAAARRAEHTDKYAERPRNEMDPLAALIYRHLGGEQR